jgi:hypothetical protein
MKKIICISLLFSANCFAMMPMQDNDLSVVSGQSGITIDITTESDITVGELRYEDKTDGVLEKDGGGAFSLRDIVIKDSEFSFDIDISAAGELAMKLNSFGVMDIDVGAMQFNYDGSLNAIDPTVLSSEAQLLNQYGRLGALAINDFTLGASSDITFKFTNEGEFAYSASLPTGSFFYFTYIDDGEFTYDTNGDGDATLNDTAGKNYISTRVEFENLVLSDVKFKGVGVGDDSYVAVTLGGTQGGVSFRDININGNILGSAGFENISVNPVSYLHIKGH